MLLCLSLFDLLLQVSRCDVGSTNQHAGLAERASALPARMGHAQALPKEAGTQCKGEMNSRMKNQVAAFALPLPNFSTMLNTLSIGTGPTFSANCFELSILHVHFTW